MTEKEKTSLIKETCERLADQIDADAITLVVISDGQVGTFVLGPTNLGKQIDDAVAQGAVLAISQIQKAFIKAT